MKGKLFLVTGMMRSMANWQIPIKLLKKQLTNYDVIALNVPGMGEFYKDKSPISMDANVEFLRKEYLKHKGERNILLGFSLGGMIATHWSQKYPHDMNGLILVTTSFGGLQPFWKRLKLTILYNVFMSFITSGLTREKYVFRMIARNDLHFYQLTHQWSNEQKKHPISRLNIIRQLISGWTFHSKNLIKHHPVLVIAAKKDQLVDYSCSENIYEFWQTDFVINPDAGHDVMNDDPKWCCENIQGWLDEKA